MKQLIRYRGVLIFLALFGLIYLALPISGQVTINPSNAPIRETWPKITVQDHSNATQTVIATGETAWTNVRLEVDNQYVPLSSHGTRNSNNQWVWRWQVQNAKPQATYRFYHSCHIGCQAWTTVHSGAVTVNDPPTAIPTKLGIVFANQDRDWHGRQGWDVEITYAQLAENEFWGIDDLAHRVQVAHEKGLLVLVRVEYAEGQSLPAPNDYVALDAYFEYLRRLANDDRLANVYGYIIGSNFNTLGANLHEPDNLVTPEWYAQIFNGYGLAVSRQENAVEIVRSEHPQMRVLMGPVSPWSADQSGALVYEVDAPWLNYMFTAVSHICESSQNKASAGFANVSPDGFAVQAFGRVNHAQLAESDRALEPTLDLHEPAWGEAQFGFRVYKDWLNIINSCDVTEGKPVYINASNTFDSQTRSMPADNYPKGWLTTAVHTINQEPQIYALVWFIDGFVHDEQWDMFSLTNPRGLLVDAAEEFDAILR